MTEPHDGVQLEWHGCYDHSWRDIITDASFAHPAKMARGLLDRILDHGLERGYWKAGDLLADPFGGIGTTGILASYKGLWSVSVELEPRFVEMAKANFGLHAAKLKALGSPQPVMLEGDSRRLASLVSEAGAIVTSPPYVSGGHHPDQTGAWGGKAQSVDKDLAGYGQAPGQIGRLPAGDVQAVITSPPYAKDALGHAGGEGPRTTNAAHTKPGTPNTQTYGATPGNIGNLKEGDVAGVVTSPPYSQPHTGGGGINVKGYGPDGADKVGDRTYQARGGEREPGNIETLPEGDAQAVRGIVTSPPYAANEKHDYLVSDDGKTRRRDERRGYEQGRGCFRGSEHYGEAEGQIGRESQETYWAAMKTVYEQCRIVLRPGGVLAVVIKRYVKQGKIVPLPDQTWGLLLTLGFEPLERVRAMLVKETREAGLFGEVVEKVERKSFFRRLAEGKGAPPIDWEDVLFVKR